MTKQNKDLLGTKIKDLTPAVRKQVEVPLGTSKRPFPMWGTQATPGKDGQKELTQVLSSIADDHTPLMVYSDRPFDEVMALLYCDMPVPSMLPILYDGLERRRPESKNRTQFVIGNPGHGKSYLGALQGRVRSRKPVEVFDCGGKNMNELLFELVLDFGAGDALPLAVDKRLKAGVLQSLSLGLLKGLDRDIDSEVAELQSKNASEETIAEVNARRIVSLKDDGQIASIDWNALKTAGTTKVEAAFDVLTKVSKIEGLDTAGGNALGMNSQYGPLIRWFLESREGVLDEYNKSREGTDNALQTVWQFLNGEIDTCTVENPLKNKDNTSGPSTFTFRREDMSIGFFITLTGNKTEDGLTTRSLNKSVYSRLSPQTLPDPQDIDWQHRICQMLTGVPVSTLHAVYNDMATKDPAAFGSFLLALRRKKAETQGLPVPAHQETLLENWQRVLSASEKLAKFYSEWSNKTDVEKLAQHPDLGDEVDEEYCKKEGIDFRKIIQHIDEALPIRPRMERDDAQVFVDFKNFLTAPELPAEKPEENQLLNFGTRLVEFLERMVYEKTEAVGKTKLYASLREAMKTHGLRDVVLKEAARSKQKSVEDDLNVSAFSGEIGKQAKIARKIVCDYLRQIQPEMAAATDDDIVTVKKIYDALNHINVQETATTKELFIVNSNLDAFITQPIMEAHIIDAVLLAEAKRVELKLPDGAPIPPEKFEVPFELTDLVRHDDLMASLALPTVSSKNVSAIWEENLRRILKVDEEKKDGKPAETKADPIDIAEGKLANGIAMTTLRVSFNDASEDARDVSVHIVRNNATGKTLVVSEALPSKLIGAFKEAGVTHVNRNDDNAQSRVETAIIDLTRGMPEKVRTNMGLAFKFRNDIANDDKRSLSQWMVDTDTDITSGKYLVKGKKAAI